MRRQQGRAASQGRASGTKKKRATYDQAFKLKVVKEALLRPPNNRIKPTCARFPGIEPCQLRKWIRNLEAEARPPAGKRPKAARAPAPAKVEVKHKPKPAPKPASEPQKAAAPAPQRTPRRAAAAARLRVVLYEQEEEEDEDEDGDEEEQDGEEQDDEEAAEEDEEEVADSVMEDASEDGSLGISPSPPCTPRSDDDSLDASASSRRAQRRATSNRTPDKSFRDVHGSDSAEIKPIFRRAASTKAGRMQRSLSLGARAELQNAFGKDGCGSQWFLPVDENDVSPREWVDEWLSEVASEEGSCD